jgi:hypothetical protein
MLNSLRTADPFETCHKNRSSLKVVLFVFKIFKMATNIKVKKNKNKLFKIFKWKDFNRNGYLQWVRHATPYGDHFGLLWRPFWIKNGRQNTKKPWFGEHFVSNWILFLWIDIRHSFWNWEPLMIFRSYHFLLLLFFFFLSFFRQKFIRHISRGLLNGNQWNLTGILTTMSRCADYFRNFQNGRRCHVNGQNAKRLKNTKMIIAGYLPNNIHI